MYGRMLREPGYGSRFQYGNNIITLLIPFTETYTPVYFAVLLMYRRIDRDDQPFEDVHLFYLTAI